MKAVLLSGAALVLLLSFAPSARAQVLGDDDSDVFNTVGISDGCAGTMNPDECMWSGSGAGGDYTTCMAMKEQRCQDAVQSLKYPNRKTCAGVQYNAACYCDGGTLATKGFCTYMR